MRRVTYFLICVPCIREVAFKDKYQSGSTAPVSPHPNPLPKEEGDREHKVRVEKVIEIFKASGALLEGHFILSSGLHSAAYLQCAIALQAPAAAGDFGAAIAAQFCRRQN